MTWLVIPVGLLALATPAASVSIGRRMAPDRWARLALGYQLVGLALVEGGLVLWSLPTVLEAFGAVDAASMCRQMLGAVAPGGEIGGWIAGATATAVGGSAVRAGYRARRAQRRLRVEPWLGAHHRLGRVDVVVVPTRSLVAYSVGGRPPQIVVSAGLREVTDEAGFRLIVAHETVHARQRHHWFLVAVSVVESAFRWYPPALLGARHVRMALERWADEGAAGKEHRVRESLRRALVAYSTEACSRAVAAFGSAETVRERIEALSSPAVKHPRPIAGVMAAAFGGVALGGSGLLAAATALVVTAVATPGFCPLTGWWLT